MRSLCTVRTTQLSKFALVLAILASLVAGCGTGGGIAGSTNVPGGNGVVGFAGPGSGALGTLKVDLVFPTAKNKLVVDFPATSNVLVHVLSLLTHRDVVPPVSAQRPAGATDMSVEIPNLEPGRYAVFVECFDPQGNTAGFSIPEATVVALQTVTVMVTGTVTVSTLTVTPATATVAAGATQQYVATATFSDGTSQNVTVVSSWASSATGIATIGATTGLATGVAAGTTNITATLGAATSAAVTLTVTGAGPSPTPSPSPTPTPDANFYAYDASNNRIMQFDDTHTHFVAYGSAGDPNTQGQFGTLKDFMKADGKLYAMSFYNSKYYVTQMNDMQGNGWVTFEVPAAIGGQNPNGMCASNGKVYFWQGAFGGDTTIWQVDAETGANVTPLAFNEATYYCNAFWAHNGKLYLLQSSNVQGGPPSRVKRLDNIAGDNPVTWAAEAGSATDWITLDDLDRIYWADYNNNRIIRIDDMTGAGRVNLTTTITNVPEVGPLQVQVNSLFHIAVNGETETDYLYFWNDMAGTNGHRDFGPPAGSGDWQTGNGSAPQWGQ